ncbi:hypothetical protein Tco_1378380 [Tanacetum coccineum]
MPCSSDSQTLYVGLESVPQQLSVVLKVGMLTERQFGRDYLLKKNTKKRGNSGEPNRYGNAREDNKRSRIGRVFAIVTSPARKEYMGTAPKCTNYNYHHLPEVPCRMYTNCNCFGHFAKRIARVRGQGWQTRPRWNEHQDKELIIQINLWLLMGVKVVEIMATRHVEGDSCWEHRRLARTQTL